MALHPLMKLVATASSDATVRIYKNRKLKNKQEFFHKYVIKQREEFDEKSLSAKKEKSDSKKIENENLEPNLKTDHQMNDELDLLVED